MLKLYMVRTYDKFLAGTFVVFSLPVGISLCRNANPFGVPANEKSLKAAEKAKIVNKACLVEWCGAIGVDADGTMEELRERLLDKLKELKG